MLLKMHRLYSGIMEAAWLAAVCVLPIFFNIYSSRIFEPDKAAILRSLALLTLGAWLLKLIGEGFDRWKNNSNDNSLIRHLWQYPMLAPVIGLVFIYFLSTIFSVTPLNSLLGSYQRLQGTYTTLSYLIIFIAITTNLKSQEQVNRFVTTVIYASLPVALYGLLQRYQIDPIPWGGNVSTRIAANMGNSIFVAAYLIMVFPLTATRMLEAFREILKNESGDLSRSTAAMQIIRATLYVFILALQLIAVYMSGSRGPMLGLFAGSYLFILLLSIYWKKRRLTYTVITLALMGVIFLAIFNINNGPLERLKKSPVIGRFGLLLDPESNSALVRQFIWDGTYQLTSVHDPIKFPDGSTDKFNILRPLIGYGPESMYVAYNQFYQPKLGQVEKRNASPDRSHNETWDSLVITGWLGLFVYLTLFSSVFFYGLKWQGLISNKRERVFFFLCLFGGGLVGAIILILLKGIEFFGIGLPVGMIVGIVLYLTVYAAISLTDVPKSLGEQNNYLLIALFAAIIGHFLEINFGIAIVVTRTLFWSYAGLMLVIGYVIPKAALSEMKTVEEVGSTFKELTKEDKRKKRSTPGHRARNISDWHPIIGDQPDWIRNSLISAIIISLVLVTLGFDYITNAGHSTSIVRIIIDAFTRLPNKDNAFSFGILMLVIMTWLVGVLIFNFETTEASKSKLISRKFVVTAGFSMSIGLLFWLLHAISLAILAGFIPKTQGDVLLQVNSIGALLTKYYIYLFLLLAFVAFLLPKDWPQRNVSVPVINKILAPVSLIIFFIAVNLTNLQVIHADITFKMADPFTKSGQWQVASFLYKRALELAPKEDHYYLFLGRSYLEQAKVTESPTDQDTLVHQAESDLMVAQSINPLNTDHTANLARLYSWWASNATNQDDLLKRGGKASDYYATAVTLSPNNSTLWDEWAVLFMQILGNSNEALLRLEHALSLDARYSFTQGLLGDYYLRIANSVEDSANKISNLEIAARYYQTAADVAKSTDATSKATYLVSLGSVYLIIDNLDASDNNHAQLHLGLESVLKSSENGINKNDQWKVQEIIAKLYKQLGDKAMAQQYASLAISGAPESALARLQDLNHQIQGLP